MDPIMVHQRQVDATKQEHHLDPMLPNIYVDMGIRRTGLLAP